MQDSVDQCIRRGSPSRCFIPVRSSTTRPQPITTLVPRVVGVKLTGMTAMEGFQAAVAAMQSAKPYEEAKEEDVTEE